MSYETSGVKISSLNTLGPIVANDDLFVIVDATANETKNVTYETVMTYDNSGTSLSATGIPGAVIEIDGNLTVHIDDETIHYPMSAINGLTPDGGDYGYILTKNSGNDYDYSWKPVSGTSVTDVSDNNTYLRTNGAWVPSDAFSSNEYYTSAVLDLLLDEKTDQVDFDDHITDLGIHFEVSAVNHELIQNIGTHSHDLIDDHIDDPVIHVPTNDAFTTDQNLWSAQKIQDELDDKEDYLGNSLADGYVLATSGAGIRYWIENSTLPTGGDTGQFLAKTTSADYDYEWAYPSTGGTGVYHFDSDTTATYPGVGHWKTNNSDTSSATTLYISSLNSEFNNLGILYATAKLGSKFVVQSDNYPNTYYIFEVAGPSISHDSGSWYEIPMIVFLAGSRQILDEETTQYYTGYVGDMTLEQVLTKSPDAGDLRIENLGNPISGTHAVNVNYMTSALDNYYTKTSVDLLLDTKTDQVDFDVHVGDLDIHYEVSAIDHTNIQNIGTNTHSQIDSHISSTLNPHSVSASQIPNDSVAPGVNVDDALNELASAITTNANDLFTHESDSSIHYTVSAIDHGLIQGLGDDDHTQYHNDTRGDARYYTQTQVNLYLNDKADKVVSATDGNIANLDSTGNLTDSGYTIQTSVPSGAVFTDTTYTDAEIKTKYENNANTNAFTDAEKTKLNNLETSKFIGEYVTLPALVSANPTPTIGEYGYVNSVGVPVKSYIWDDDDTTWVDSTPSVITSHNLLTGRSDADVHPISSITDAVITVNDDKGVVTVDLQSATDEGATTTNSMTVTVPNSITDGLTVQEDATHRITTRSGLFTVQNATSFTFLDVNGLSNNTPQFDIANTVGDLWIKSDNGNVVLRDSGSNTLTLNGTKAVFNSRVQGLSATDVNDFVTLSQVSSLGGGDVTGPASSIDANIATFNGVTGKLIQDSGTQLSSLATVSSLGDYATSASLESHTSDSTIHFTEASLDLQQYASSAIDLQTVTDNGSVTTNVINASGFSGGNFTTNTNGYIYIANNPTPSTTYTRVDHDKVFVGGGATPINTSIEKNLITLNNVDTTSQNATLSCRADDVLGGMMHIDNPVSDTDNTTINSIGATSLITKGYGDATYATSASENPMTTQGDVIYGGSSGTPTRLGIGTAGQVLVTNSGATAPEWADAPSTAPLAGLAVNRPSGTVAEGTMYYVTDLRYPLWYDTTNNYWVNAAGGLVLPGLP